MELPAKTSVLKKTVHIVWASERDPDTDRTTKEIWTQKNPLDSTGQPQYEQMMKKKKKKEEEESHNLT